MPEPLITLDPACTSGHRTVVRGTSWSVVAVLRHLASGITEERLVGDPRLLRHHGRPLTSADVRAAVAHAASVCRSGGVSAQAMEAFLRDSAAFSLSRDVARQAIPLAVPVLEQTAEGRSAEETVGAVPGLAPEMVRGALLWGAAAVYDGSVAATGLAAEKDTSLRQLLGADDRSLLDDYYRFVNALSVAYLTVTPERQFAAWRRFVEAVELGYGDHDEYTRELGERDGLADAVDLASPEGRRRLEQQLAPWDDRFLATTRPSSVSMAGRRRWLPRRWWWYRVPKLLVAEMEAQLGSYGVLPD